MPTTPTPTQKPKGIESYHGDRRLPLSDLEAVHLYHNLDELDGRSLLLIAGRGKPLAGSGKGGKRGGRKRPRKEGEWEPAENDEEEDDDEEGRGRPRVVVAMFVDPKGRVEKGKTLTNDRVRNGWLVGLFGGGGRGKRGGGLPPRA